MQSSSHSLDRMEVVFDDANAVANGGLCLPMTLADRLGLTELIDTKVDLGDAPGHANVGAKAMGLIASALAGGDSIDDADVLRSGHCEVAMGQAMPAPSTLGTFLRSFTWAHARRRVLRRVDGREEPFRPRRARCRSCRKTHVLLPESGLIRRRDEVAVIGTAVQAKAGAGHRPIAVSLGPARLYRSWLASSIHRRRRGHPVPLHPLGSRP